MYGSPIAGTLRRLLRGLRWELGRHNILRFERAIVCRLDTSDPRAGQSKADLSVKQGGPPAIDCLVRWGLEPREEYERRMDRGDVLFIARMGAVPAGFQWVAFNRWDSHWIEHSFPLDGDVWLHDAFVDPSYRRQGIYTAMLRHVLRWAQGKGHAHAYCLVMQRNRPSVVAHERNGWLPFEQISYWQLLFLACQRVWGARGRSVMTRLGHLEWRRGADLRARASLPALEATACSGNRGLRLGQGVERSGAKGPG